MSSKVDFTVYLKYFIFPFICVISIIVIYFVLIFPYLNLRNEMDLTRESKRTQIQNFETKLSVLQKARANKDELNSYLEKLNSLVPADESPAPLVGNLDSISTRYNFTRVDENKNIADQSLTNQGFIEVRFNGRTVGPLSALNFITALNSSDEKLINLRNIEIFDDRESKYYRISFIARSVFNKNKSVSALETPVFDILSDLEFQNFMKNYNN